MEHRYGDDKTIHRTTMVNVETDSKGKVVAVWFRCMALPFDQSTANKQRAEEMRSMYKGKIPSLKAVVVEHD
jgi:hypothetical protein